MAQTKSFNLSSDLSTYTIHIHTKIITFFWKSQSCGPSSCFYLALDSRITYSDRLVMIIFREQRTSHEDHVSSGR